MRTPFGDLPDSWVASARMSDQHDHLQARLGRRTLLTAAALSPVLRVRPSAAAAGTPLTRHVGFGADPRSSAVVSFGVSGPFRRAAVEYGTGGRLDRTAEVDVRTVRGVRTLYGHAALDGLSPGTPYAYRVRLDGVASDVATLTTAPAGPAGFTFTAFGDQGVTPEAMAVLGQIARVRPAFHLLSGDLCYADASGRGGPADTFDPTVWDSWLRMIQPVAAQTAWMCAPGNHEMEPGYGPQGYDGYLSRFSVPTGGARGCPTTYAFRYGGVGVLCLDANDVSYEIPHDLGYSGGRQTAWLEAQLAAMRAPGSGVDFVVVVFHHCAYSTSAGHGSEGGVRDHWVPLFDRYEVDLAVNGHAHAYERTSPLRAGRVTSRAARGASVDARLGTTYVTAGGGGASASSGFTGSTGYLVGPDGTRHPEHAPWSLPTRTTAHVFLAVTVRRASADSPATMHVRAVEQHGRLVDEVTLQRAHVPPASGAASRDRLPWVAAGTVAAGTVAAGAAGAVAWRSSTPRSSTVGRGSGQEVTR